MLKTSIRQWSPNLSQRYRINIQIMYFIIVNIKWGKEKFSDVECNTDEPPEVFKAQLFALSGVQPDRQKVMLKGMVVKVNMTVI